VGQEEHVLRRKICIAQQEFPVPVAGINKKLPREKYLNKNMLIIEECRRKKESLFQSSKRTLKHS